MVAIAINAKLTPGSKKTFTANNKYSEKMWIKVITFFLFLFFWSVCNLKDGRES